MNFRHALLCSLCAFSLMFTACNNDDDNNFSEADLSANAWVVTDVDTNIDEVASAIADAVPQEELDNLGLTRAEFAAFLILLGASEETIEDCQQDDTHTFATDGSIQFDNGGTMCDFSTEEDDDAMFALPATWTLSGDKITITDADGETNTATIKTLNSSTLVVESRDMFEDDDLMLSSDEEVVFTITFSAK